MSGLQKNERDLYIILDQFLLGKMDPITFENEFHIAYFLEECVNELSDQEDEIFDDLADTVKWFNPFEAERLRNGFVGPETMREAALLAKKKLDQLKKKNEML